MTLAASFVTLDFSSLRQISGDLNLNGKSGMTGIVFQRLEQVGGIDCDGHDFSQETGISGCCGTVIN